MPTTTKSRRGFLLKCPTVPRWQNDIVGCGSANIGEPDDEGFFDCLNCGLFFKREAALEGKYRCSAVLSKEPTRICRSTKLIWHELERYFDCLACGAQIPKDDAIKA